MVDPNPARGMPAKLKRYWLVGKGAAKIRWGVPGDWARCVRQLRKYFPTDPEGLCANLHHDALGEWPGREHQHAIELEEAAALLAAAPILGDVMWMAPLAPIGIPTGDGRMFRPGALSFRALPLPLEWAKARNGGHAGAVTVGRILGTTIGPDATGQEYAWGYGDLFDPAVIPEAAQALALIEGGVAGLSLDPGGFVEVMRGDEGSEFTSYRAGGATLVSIPAFEGQRVYIGSPDDFDDDDDELIRAWIDAMEGDEAGSPLDTEPEGCGCAAEVDEEAEFAVNRSGWRGLPIAARETSVDRDDAIRRIAIWANNDTAQLNRAFLWRHDQGNPQSVYSYRLPIGDVIDGKLHLIYHAIYAASALLEGAHGGLPNISDAEKEQMRNVISGIYRRMAEHFDDPTIRASWDRETKRDNGVTGKEDEEGDAGDFAQEDTMALTTLAEEILAEEGILVAAEGWCAPELPTPGAEDVLIAAAAPVAPPKAWFTHQDMEPGPLRITPEGQFTGYLALWKTCHRSVGRGSCVKAPKSRTNYQHFQLGTVLTAEGDLVKVGRVTYGGGHADTSLGVIPAIAHYDDAGTTVVIAAAHEDQYGIQLAGAVVPEATPEQVAGVRRHPLSGDWRGVKGNLELVAALAVNTPGFPIFALEDDTQTLLAAMGIGGEDHEHVEDRVDMEQVDLPLVASRQVGELAEADEPGIVERVISALDERNVARQREVALAQHREFRAQAEQRRRADRLAQVKGE